MEYEKELKEEELLMAGLHDPYRGLKLCQARQRHSYQNDPLLREACEEFHASRQKIESLRLTVDRLWGWIQRQSQKNVVVTESEVVSEMKQGAIATSSVDKHENVTDVAGDEKDERTAGMSHGLSAGQGNLLALNEFLSRPLALTSLSVSPGSELTYAVDLWNEFLTHPSIRSKLRNYAYIRGTMNVKIAISGTPFHYGKVQVSYQPLADWNQNLTQYGAFLGTNRFLGLCYLSQAPGSAVMDVKSNKPLELSCPFISPQPMIRLFNRSPLILPEGQAFNDSAGFGKLFINSIGPILSATATPSDISMFVYAWMTDVELGAPSGTVLSVGTEADERTTGPVERVATRASEIAYALTSVPTIAPFAKASGLVLEGVGSLASLFGFSVPTINTQPIRVKNQPIQNGAQVIGCDTGKRITLDPKQELSIDPRVCGTSDDEMSIAHLCSVESLLDRFVWDSTELALSSAIWMTPVTPMMEQRLLAGALFEHQPTALSFAAAPFEYWRGDITYRFEIVCSAYHRGKLAFYYEPNVAQNTVIDTVLDLNKQFVKIIDIQETQDVSFCVQWAFPKPWAKNLPTNLIGDVGQIGFNGTDYFDYANGYIAVTPFTTLQSPDGSDISVNVYVSSDNMMFNQIDDVRLPALRVGTEAAVVAAPVEVDCVVLNPSSASMDNISEEYFGETPVSFRSLLKRFTSWTNYSDWEIATGGADTFGFYRHPIIPDPYPLYNGADDGKTRYLFGYLRYAYLGLRGGLRHRLSVVGNMRISELGKVRVKLQSPNTSSGHFFIKSDDLQAMESTLTGCVNFMPHTNGGIEYEAPMYTNNQFGISFSRNPFPTSCTLLDSRLTRSVDVLFLYRACAENGVYMDHTIATGEDFSFIRFQGAPSYLEPNTR